MCVFVCVLVCSFVMYVLLRLCYCVCFSPPPAFGGMRLSPSPCYRVIGHGAGEGAGAWHILGSVPMCAAWSSKQLGATAVQPVSQPDNHHVQSHDSSSECCEPNDRMIGLGLFLHV